MPRPCQSEDFLSPLSLHGLPPLHPTLESGYEEGTVSITQIKWLLATLCWACPPFVDVVVSCSFFFFLFYLSPSPALSSLSPSLALLALPCSFSSCQFVSGHPGGTAEPTHIHTHTLRNTYTDPTYSRDLGNNWFCVCVCVCLWVYIFFSGVLLVGRLLQCWKAAHSNFSFSVWLSLFVLLVTGIKLWLRKKRRLLAAKSEGFCG